MIVGAEIFHDGVVLAHAYAAAGEPFGGFRRQQSRVASATFEEAIRLQAADFSSFTSTSPQDVQVKNSKFEWPSGFGTLRTSFMMPPQD
jgi:hypothetical protein